MMLLPFSSPFGGTSRVLWAFSPLIVSFLVAGSLLTNVQPVASAGIDCFKCVSLNHSNPSCEDPFHNNYTTKILERPCMGGRKGRNGLFPASSCTKVVGDYADGSGSIMIRGCSVDSGTLTTDTELIRMSHCGSFYFNEKYVYGCVQSCDDVDACNSAVQTTLFTMLPRLQARHNNPFMIIFYFFILSYSRRTNFLRSGIINSL